MLAREPREDPHAAKGIKNLNSLQNSSLVARHNGFDRSIACCTLQAQRTKSAHGAYGRPSESFPCCPRYRILIPKPFSASELSISEAGNNSASCANNRIKMHYADASLAASEENHPYYETHERPSFDGVRKGYLPAPKQSVKTPEG